VVLFRPKTSMAWYAKVNGVSMCAVREFPR
jgi:hypothetical protein